jgi:hypothetical protein
MPYQIVAEREGETVKMERHCSLIAIANARVWASEGWDVTIVADDASSTSVGDDGLLCSTAD